MSPYHDHGVLVQQGSPIVHLKLILHSRQLLRKRHKSDPLKLAQILLQLSGPLYKLHLDLLKSVVDSLQRLIEGSVGKFNPGVGA